MAVGRTALSIPAPRSKTLTFDARAALQALAARAFAPVAIASIVYFRIVFGLVMCWEVYRYFTNGWIKAYYIDPPYNFAYAGFEWVKPWPGVGMYLHFLALGLLAMLIALGWWYRIATVLFFLGFSYVFLLEKAHYLNHFYFIILLSFLMIFIPANRAFAKDAAKTRPRPEPVAPAWALWLLRFQLGVVYFYGGLAKLNGDWLQGVPMRSWLADRTDFPIIGRWFTDEWMVMGFVYGGLLFDLLIVPLLLWPRTRWLAFAAAAVFHMTNAQLFNIGIFPWLALAASLIFFPPDFPRRVGHWLGISARPDGSRSGKRGKRLARRSVASAPFVLTRGHRLTLAAIGVYVALQLLVPLRHHLYPGDVAWTEEGHRFSWRMKLRDKGGSVAFFATDPARNATWQVDPDDYLTSKQVRNMVGKPDMIVQFSHYLADRLRSEGHGDVEIRAEAMVSLNGREPQLLIDPNVNLAATELSPLPMSFILPLTTPLEPDADGSAEANQVEKNEAAGE